MSTLNVNKIADASGGVLAPISSVMRNRIINGAMVIAQRGTSSLSVDSATTYYPVDRFGFYGSVASSKFTAQQSSTAPAGFSKSLLLTSSSSYSVAAGDFFYGMQGIEGYNAADLNWGTANAKTITISFWVRSSVTGNFGAVLRNLIGGADRGYPFLYNISAANTWEQKSLTIAGDTSGTWLTDNGCGMAICFSVGSGSTWNGTPNAWATGNFIGATGQTNLLATNGATFYITGVQLEVGTQATGFEYRQYGQELALCQRYCEAYYQDASTSSPISWQYVADGHYFTWQFKTQKRAQAAVSKINGTWVGSTPGIAGGISTANISSGSPFYLNSTAGTLNLLATAEL